MTMPSCFGLCGSTDDSPEREPLLPQYHDDTARQERLHEKLHTYQIIRAMSKGYMPSNVQTIIHLRTLLSASVLNPAVDTTLSSSGRALVRTTRLLIKQLIDLLDHKNSKDQIQDFLWYLQRSRLDVDAKHISRDVSKSKAKAHWTATSESLQTIASLALLNKDFRIFVADLATISKQVLRDTALKLGDVSTEAGKQLDESAKDIEVLKKTDQQNQASAPPEDLKSQAAEVAEAVYKDATEVGKEAYTSMAEHMNDEAQGLLIGRLKRAVSSLRQRTDYSESVSTLARLLQNYLLIYLSVGSDAANTIEDNIQTNRQADQAAHNFWLFISSIGDRERWEIVRTAFRDFVDNNRSDENLEDFVQQFANLLQQMLSNPDFFNHIDDRLSEVREKVGELTSGSSMGHDVVRLITALKDALQSVADDEDIRKVGSTILRIIQVLSPSGEALNSDLITDSVDVFVPLIVQGIQYIPIPRIEISTPEIDLLAENLILQPGQTINNSSFLPFNLQLSTRNDVDVTKAQFGTRTSITTLLTIKVAGLSIAADDLGYWLKLHSGFLQLVDEGLGSFHLDERGIDITLDVEIGRERLEELVTLRSVDVQIHHLDYTLSKSRFSCIAWLLKPFIRPIVRRALEVSMASAIEDGLRTLNRELVFARERLRATRICNPNDLWTFVRAVMTRLLPAPDPDVQARLGVLPGEGVFKGRYAPGSLVKLWQDEGQDADQNVFEYQQGGWRNDIFDVSTSRGGYVRGPYMG